MLTRCSAAGRAINCGASVLPTANPYNPDSQAAIDGTAAHVALQHVVADRELSEQQIAEIADQHRASAEHVAAAYRGARKIWHEVQPCFPSPRTEVPVAGKVTRGTSDVVSIVPGERLWPKTIACLDWKTGRGQIDHTDQLAAYADALAEMYGIPESGYVLAVEAWVLHGTWRIHKFTRAQLDTWRDRLHDSISNGFATPGSWCTFCPRQLECDARGAYIVSTAAALTVPGESALFVPLGDLYKRAKLLRGALARYDELVKATIAERGYLELSDGRRVIDAGREVSEIDPALAWPVLARWFDGDEVAGAISVSKTKLLALAKAQAKRGEKEATARNLLEDLTEAGAISTVRQSRLAIVDETGSKEDE